MKTPHRAQPAAPRANRQRERTRTALLRAGQHLFATRALGDVSIDEIANVADVAKGSFYNHFEDKDDLARAIIELVQGDCEFHILSANRDIGDPAFRIARALCVLVRYSAEHPERLLALLSLGQRKTLANAPLNAGVATDVREGLESGRLHDVTLETGVVTVLGLINITVQHAREWGAERRADIAIAMGATLLRALGMETSEAAALALQAAREILPSKESVP